MHKYSYKQIYGIARFNTNMNNVFACQEQNVIITASKSCLRRDGEVRHINVNSTGLNSVIYNRPCVLFVGIWYISMYAGLCVEGGVARLELYNVNTDIFLVYSLGYPF